MDGLTFDEHGEPRLKRSYNLRFVGDWGSQTFTVSVPGSRKSSVIVRVREAGRQS